MADDPTQPFSSVLDRLDNPQGVNRIGGMAVFEGNAGYELLLNAYEYYDAPGTIRTPASLCATRPGWRNQR
mgnify:FL=1